MKIIILLMLTSLSLSNASGQTDSYGNPIFNNELISEEEFDNFELTSNYYTTKDNISNKESSVYVSDNPAITDYLDFSRNLPSYFFIVHRERKMLGMIVLLQKNEGSKTTLTYFILNPENGKSMEAPCSVFGEITEKRVEELEEMKIDTESKLIDMPNGKFYVFNGIMYFVQPYDSLKAEVIEIAKQFAGQ
jgi:hypothetical protein